MPGLVGTSEILVKVQNSLAKYVFYVLTRFYYAIVGTI